MGDIRPDPESDDERGENGPDTDSDDERGEKDPDAESDNEKEGKDLDTDSDDEKTVEGKVAPAPTSGCEKECTFEGQSAPRGARIKFSLEEGKATCDDAWGLVRSQCKVCGTCRVSECPALIPDSAPGSKRDSDDEVSAADDADDEQASADDEAKSSKSPCDTDCFWDGITATCGDRITYSARQEGGSCSAAEHLIHGQCSECVECTAKAAGCSD